MSLQSSPRPWLYGVYTALALASISSIVVPAARSQQAGRTDAPARVPLVTGKYLSAQEGHVPVGSYPNRALRSPDGKWVIVSSLGFRTGLHVVDTATGKVVSKLELDGPSAKDKAKSEGLFYGLAFGPAGANGAFPVYVSRGSDDHFTCCGVHYVEAGSKWPCGKCTSAQRVGGGVAKPGP